MISAAICISNLSKYYGKTRGIERVDLEVEEGEIFGFIGPNGSGKSTTIRILLNLIFPDSGTANVLGLNVIKHKAAIMEHVGYVPSDANAYPGLIVEDFFRYCSNFYSGKINETRIIELSKWFDLDLKQRISDLSLGNRKKVSIVQSLLHRPKLLILDEPTTGLDPLMQAKFFDLLKLENKNGMTIFISSHILNEVQMLCKKVAIIKEGRIIGIEEIESLRKKQLKKVMVDFKNISDLHNFKIPTGEINVIHSGNSISFMYSGDINELIRLLSSEQLSYLTIEDPSLEEIFMHYYYQ